MNIVSKLETRVLMALAVVVSILGTVLIMNFMVIKPMRKMYEVQAKQQNELIVELAKMQKYAITNTYSIKKPKKGSSLILTPDNEIVVQEMARAVDEKISKIESGDSVNVQIVPNVLSKPKTWWQKIFGKP